jgi:phage gp29-like protein
VPALPLTQQYSRIGGNKTPQKVSNIIRLAESGRPSQLVDLSNDCRQIDGHLQSCLGTRETALVHLPVSVKPYQARGEKEPTDEDSVVAGFVEDALTGACGDGQDTRSFTDTIAQLQSAVYMGYASSEIDWVRDGRWLVPAGFAPIDQRRFEFRQTDGRLVWNDSWGMANGIDLMTVYPGKFIQHQPRINGDVPAREGLNKLLVWAATFRNWDVADWLQLAEMSWKPWRIGRYSKGAGEEDQNRLAEALRHLTTNGIATIREDHNIDIRWPEGGQARGGRGSHQQLAEWLGAEMSKAILGQTLTVEQGERGARSLGEVHDRVRKDLREYDAKSVAATFTRDLIRWLVWFNFGPETPLPVFSFVTDDAVDMSEFAGGLKDLTEAGLDIGAKWARDQVGVPDPEAGEKLVSGVAYDVDLSGLDEEDDSDEEEPQEADAEEDSAESDSE